MSYFFMKDIVLKLADLTSCANGDISDTRHVSAYRFFFLICLFGSYSILYSQRLRCGIILIFIFIIHVARGWGKEWFHVTAKKKSNLIYVRDCFIIPKSTFVIWPWSELNTCC